MPIMTEKQRELESIRLTIRELIQRSESALGIDRAICLATGLAGCYEICRRLEREESQ